MKLLISFLYFPASYSKSFLEQIALYYPFPAKIQFKESIVQLAYKSVRYRTFRLKRNPAHCHHCEIVTLSVSVCSNKKKTNRDVSSARSLKQKYPWHFHFKPTPRRGSFLVPINPFPTNCLQVSIALRRQLSGSRIVTEGRKIRIMLNRIKTIRSGWVLNFLLGCVVLCVRSLFKKWFLCSSVFA